MFHAGVVFANLVWERFSTKVPSSAPATLGWFSARGRPEASGSPQRCLSEPCQRETSGTSLGIWLLSPEGPPAYDTPMTIHVDERQKLTQCCKAIVHQLKISNS